MTKEERNDTNVGVSKKENQGQSPGVEEKHCNVHFHILLSLRDKPTLQV